MSKLRTHDRHAITIVMGCSPHREASEALSVPVQEKLVLSKFTGRGNAVDPVNFLAHHCGLYVHTSIPADVRDGVARESIACYFRGRPKPDAW